jgi:CheY-like chemotaxis protein
LEEGVLGGDLAKVTDLSAEPTTRGIPVMAMTASVMGEDRQRIMGAGFDAYQGKPITVNDFVAAVAQLLERPRA